MARKILEATPGVVDTLKKANVLVNSSTLKDQLQQGVKILTKIDGNISGQSDLIPAKVVSGDGLNGYLCNIYRNGLDNPPSEQGTVFLANGASTIHTLPAGTVLFVQKTSIPIHGSAN